MIAHGSTAWRFRVCLFTGACFVPAAFSAPDPETVVARVGKRDINRRDVWRRQGVEFCYGEGKTREEAVIVVMLLQDALNREVARMHDLLPEENEIAVLEHHAENTTRAPKLLKCVQAIFQEDDEAYRRIYLEPKVIEQKLRAHHSATRDYHSDVVNRIESAWGAVAAGGETRTVAEQLGLSYVELFLETPPDWDEQKREDPVPVADDSLREIAKNLKIGELFQNVVETDRDFKVIRLQSRDESQKILQTISGMKSSYDDWFRSEAEWLKVEILDHEIRSIIEKKYANVWWLRSAWN